jgi:hypothetical protein
MKKLMLLALAAGTAVAMVGTGYPAAAGQIGKDTDCVVQYVDEHGQVRDTSTEPEGTVRGEFRCVAGAWQYSWAPGEFITAPQLQVNPAGAVSVPEFQRPERSRNLTLGEMAGIARAVSGSKEVVFMRAVVAVDDGRERTAEEVEALLAGKDTTGAKVLRTIDRPDPAMTVQDVVGDTGGGQGPVVVYFWSEIWDAITDAVNWVIDGINEIGDWINDHCTWFPPPPPGSPDIPIVTCQF